jgi:Fungal specific transcription factor domain
MAAPDRPRGPNLSFLEEVHERKRARIEAAREALYKQHEASSPVKWNIRALSAPAVTTLRSFKGRGSGSQTQDIVVRTSQPASPSDLVIPVAEDDDHLEFSRLLSAATRDIEEWSRRSPAELTAYVRSNLQPVSDALDPFNTLPTRLDTFKEHLISFYLLVYPRTAYGFSSKLTPGPVGKSFGIGLTSPGTFHVNLARAALHRLSLGLHSSAEEKRALEVAALRHKGEAIRMIRALSAGGLPTSKDDLLAATINMGMVNRRYGPPESADMHFKASRRLIRVNGGPQHVESSNLEHLFLMFECGLSASKSSLIWDAPDFMAKLSQLNQFLTLLRRVWIRLSISPRIPSSSAPAQPQRLPYLRPTSILYLWLSRDTMSKLGSVYKDVREINHQMTCIFILACVFVEMYKEPARVFEYKIEIETKVRAAELDANAGYGVLNVAYIMQDVDCCLKSDSFRQIQWSVVGFIWVLRFMSDGKIGILKNWLLKFLEGAAVEPHLQFSHFDFSYMS